MIDCHLHSEFSMDSNEKIERICEKAISKNIEAIVITDHVEIPENETRPFPEFGKRSEEIRSCNEKYTGKLKIISGVEIGQPHRDKNIEKSILSRGDIDFSIASIHRLRTIEKLSSFPYSKQNYKEFVHVYLEELKEMADCTLCQVIGHLTQVFKNIDEEIRGKNIVEDFLTDWEELIRIIVKRKKIIEINVSGLRTRLEDTYPNEELLLLYRKLGGEEVTVGSDGHSERSACENITIGYDLAKKTGLRVKQL